MKHQLALLKRFIPTLAIVLIFASCNHFINLDTVTGSGNVTTENRSFDQEFTGIKSSNGIDVIIEQADKFEVIVEADDNIQESITVKVQNGTLMIGCKYDSFIGVTTKKVLVKMPVIEELQASRSSTIGSNNKIKSNSIDINTSTGSTVDLNINSDKIICMASTGSEIFLKGLALELEAKASTGSEIDTEELIANEVIANSSTGSTIMVSPSLNLRATASTGSSITYSKTPKKITKIKSTGASIELN
ncbi:head GIN domain-containing protein [Flavobacterium algicola]|uniref:head GIN domain-containing protein n=1 Tax=Flavobacterium algicola TaxID=556529 RepID=UPI001EFD1471|nr:head GIN domain-containing protein [Flavobacterium algicola]MCG9793069.1 DUF2807 domain-containing protein [Flavobacterium algicola]